MTAAFTAGPGGRGMTRRGGEAAAVRLPRLRDRLRVRRALHRAQLRLEPLPDSSRTCRTSSTSGRRSACSPAGRRSASSPASSTSRSARTSASPAVVACKVANSASPTLGLLAGRRHRPRARDRKRDRDRPHADQLVHRHARDEHHLRRGSRSSSPAGLIVTGPEPALRVARSGRRSSRSPIRAGSSSAFAIVTGFILSRTIFGRYVYAVGGNAEAARLSGVRVGRDPGLVLRALGPRGGNRGRAARLADPVGRRPTSAPGWS